jgi:hypothetical protein
LRRGIRTVPGTLRLVDFGIRRGHAEHANHRMGTLRAPAPARVRVLRGHGHSQALDGGRRRASSPKASCDHRMTARRSSTASMSARTLEIVQGLHWLRGRYVVASRSASSLPESIEKNSG